MRRRRTFARCSVSCACAKGEPASWQLHVASPAKRRIARLPEKVAAAVLEFILGPLVDSPGRVGRELGPPSAGLHSARVGAYRVLYRIDEEQHTIDVLDVDHRADVYRHLA